MSGEVTPPSPDTRRMRWFALGRDVLFALPRGCGLNPSRAQLAVAARALGIRTVDAARAFCVYSGGDVLPIKDAPTPTRGGGAPGG